MSKEKTKTLRKHVEKLETAEAIGHLNLTLVPLRGAGHGRLDYILSEEAIEGGMLTVTEVSESGSVPELLAENKSEKMILLLDGEELVGAKQNRILNTTVLLRAKSKTRIPSDLRVMSTRLSWGKTRQKQLRVPVARLAINT